MRPGERRAAYRKWIGSKAWKAIRNQALAVHGDKCVSCGVRPVEFHHVFYPADWNNTRPEHLIAVCMWHHIVVESRLDRGRVADESLIAGLLPELMVEMKKFPEPPPEPEFSSHEDFMRAFGGDIPMIGVDERFLKWLAQRSVGKGYRQWVVEAFSLKGGPKNWLKTAVGRWIPLERWWEIHRKHKSTDPAA